MTMEERLRSHYESLTRAIRFVRTTDRKAAPVLGLQIALIGALATRADKLLAIVGSEPWGIENTTLLGLALLYGTLVLIVAALATSVYVPINPKTGRSLIYFEDIASMDYHAFELRAKGMSAESIESDLLDQIHRVSQIASKKMNRVRWAFILSAPAFLSWLALFAWSVVGEA